MGKFLSICVAFLIIVSCSTPESTAKFSLIENQIDESLELTQSAIEAKKIVIKKTITLGVGVHLTYPYKTVNNSSKALDEAAYHLFEKGDQIPDEITALKTAFSNHVSTLIKFVVEDGTTENDYFIHPFSDILKGKPLSDSTFSNTYIDSLLNTGSSELNEIHLKQLYSRTKQAELMVWGYLEKVIEGNGVTMDIFQGMIDLNKNVIAIGDTIKANIYCSAKNSHRAMKIYVGEVDKSIFGNQKSKHYDLGITPRIPINGAYNRLYSNKGFKTQILGTRKGKYTFEGVIEIQSILGTTYVPFSETYIVK